MFTDVKKVNEDELTGVEKTKKSAGRKTPASGGGSARWSGETPAAEA